MGQRGGNQGKGAWVRRERIKVRVLGSEGREQGLVFWNEGGGKITSHFLDWFAFQNSFLLYSDESMTLHIK